MRADPVKSHRPDLPIVARSEGRVAASGSTLSSCVIRNLGLSKSVKDDMNPREAILRFAKDAEETPIWVTPAFGLLLSFGIWVTILRKRKIHVETKHERRHGYHGP